MFLNEKNYKKYIKYVLTLRKRVIVSNLEKFFKELFQIINLRKETKKAERIQ